MRRAEGPVHPPFHLQRKPPASCGTPPPPAACHLQHDSIYPSLLYNTRRLCILRISAPQRASASVALAAAGELASALASADACWLPCSTRASSEAAIALNGMPRAVATSLFVYLGAYGGGGACIRQMRLC